MAKDKSVRQIVHRFLESRATFFGFPRARKGDDMGGKTRRATWLCISIILTVLTIVQTYFLIAEYQEKPTVTKISIVNQPVLPFPAVTVCPMSPFKASYLSNDTLHPNVPQEMRMLYSIDMALQEVLDDVAEYEKAGFLSIPIFDSIKAKLSAQNYPISDIVEHILAKYAFFSLVRTFQDWGARDALLKEFPALESAWNGKYFDFSNFSRIVSGSFLGKQFTLDFSEIQHHRFKRSHENLDYLGEIAKRSWEDFLFSLETSPQLNPNQIQSRMKEIYIRLPQRKPDEAVTVVEKKQEAQLRSLFGAKDAPLEFQIEDVVTACSFQGRDCRWDLYRRRDPLWKTCIHFNHEFLHPGNEGRQGLFIPGGNRKRAIEKVNAAGRRNGLTLQLTIPKDEILGFLTPVEGFAVSVGDSKIMPVLTDYVTVSANRVTDLAIERLEIVRKDLPGGEECAPTDHFKNVFYDWEILGHYDRGICLELVLFRRTMDECDCVPSSDVAGAIINLHDLPLYYRRKFCTLLDQPCREYVRASLPDAASKKCPVACHKIRYNVHESSVPQTVNSTLKRIIIDGLKRNVTMTIGGIPKRNQLQLTLNIFYKNKDVEMLEEESVYSLSNFIGEFGGVVSLYIGMSFFTFLELSELLFDIITFYFGKVGSLVPARKRKGDESSISLENAQTLNASPEEEAKRLEEKFEALENELRQKLEQIIAAYEKKINDLTAQKRPVAPTRTVPPRQT